MSLEVLWRAVRTHTQSQPQRRGPRVAGVGSSFNSDHPRWSVCFMGRADCLWAQTAAKGSCEDVLCCFEPTYCIRSGLKSTKCISLTQGSVFEVVGLQHISTVTLWLLTIGYGYSKGYRFALIPGLQPTIHHLRSYCVKTTPLMSLSTMTQGPWTAQ